MTTIDELEHKLKLLGITNYERNQFSLVYKADRVYKFSQEIKGKIITDEIPITATFEEENKKLRKKQSISLLDNFVIMELPCNSIASFCAVYVKDNYNNIIDDNVLYTKVELGMLKESIMNDSDDENILIKFGGDEKFPSIIKYENNGLESGKVLLCKTPYQFQFVLDTGKILRIPKEDIYDLVIKSFTPDVFSIFENNRSTNKFIYDEMNNSYRLSLAFQGLLNSHLYSKRIRVVVNTDDDFRLKSINLYKF